ncbi:PA2817 family protein [Teredinibacter haidensis]|uniref:PA2817 family protein n=1 Tax=Teredinibacter haidensis TaxID=2731755 RepID=UPI0009489944|nr:PA2817 family protein [Teredinibacter haidensis]
MNQQLGAEYQNFHKQLITALLNKIKAQSPFVETENTTPDAEDVLFLERFETLRCDLNASEQGYPLGQWVITTIVSRYPHITPQVSRDLFWFFGGDCLHYLTDEEIKKFQRLDEVFHTQDNETDNPQGYEGLRAIALGLH